MPNPLSRVARNRKPTFTPDALFIYPDLGKLVMTVIGYGAATDVLWTHVLVDLLGSRAKVAIAMFSAIVSAPAQREAIFAAAGAKLKPVDLALFRAVQNATEGARGRRNEFAHHLWGLVYGLDNALVLMDPKDSTQHRIRANATARKVRGQLMRGQPQMPLHDFIQGIDPDNSKVMVWKAPDLIEAVAVAREAHATVKDLLALLSGSAQPDPMRRALLARHYVAQAHKKIVERTPQALPQQRRKTARKSKRAL